MKELKEIYENYKSWDGHGDKGTCHTYIDEYEKLLNQYREYGNILEIGIWTGLSLRMWRDYFINGKVVGIDNFMKPELNELINDDNYKIIIGDSTKPETLLDISDYKFDVIIDDGCHQIESQVATFNLLKNFVNKNGIYIIEDVENIDISKEILINLHNNNLIIDNRKIKNRHDDVLVVYRF